MRGRFGLAATLAVAGGLAITGAAQADTFEVTRTNDPVPGNCKRNDCSLREAILKANETPGADVVVLPNRRRAYRLAQAGASEDAGLTGDLDVNNDPLRLRHPGKGTATIDGNQLDRVLHIQAGAPTKLIKVVITGGDSVGSDGGGILSDANLKLRRSAVRANVGDDGGGIDMDGSGSLTLTRSVIAGNRADNNADSNGGGINSAGNGAAVRVALSRVSGNHALGNGGGIEAGGANLRISRSTIAQNRSEDNGGGIHSAAAGNHRIVASTINGNRAIDVTSSGGGMYFDGPVVNVVNSTVEGNRANQRGGGIHAQDGADLTLNAMTVTRNRAAADDEGLVLVGGGGLSRLSSAGFSVRNSLIGLNTIGAENSQSQNNCASDIAFESLGSNLLTEQPGGAECDGFGPPDDLVRANPKIRPLRRNGGPTKTVALKKGSAAIGNAHRGSAPNRDQRGRKRDRRPDIGAYERGA